MTAHHAICDGWSWGVISEDLGQLYAEQIGAGPSLEPAARILRLRHLGSRRGRQRRRCGRTSITGCRAFPAACRCSNCRSIGPRPAVRTFNSYRIDHLLDKDLIDATRKVGSATGTSLFATLFSAFAATLHRLTAQDDLVIGIAAAGQMPSDMPSLVGHCVNLLPIRVAVDPQAPFESLARSAGSTLLDAFEHQTLTYGALLKKLPVPRDPSRLPLSSSRARNRHPPQCSRRKRSLNV